MPTHREHARFRRRPLATLSHYPKLQLFGAGLFVLVVLRLVGAGHKLDTEIPMENQGLIPVKERETIGWEIVSRLAKENKDLIEYITLVKHLYQTGGLQPANW